MGTGRMALAAVAAAVVIGVGAELAVTATEPKPKTMRIGMIQTLFRGRDREATLACLEPFNQLIQSQTGVRGEFSLIPSAHEMAKQIQDDELQLGILHGIEYGWIKQQYPGLKPLLITFNQTYKLKSYLMVQADGPVKAIADLKGKPLALPTRSLNHCYLHLHKSIADTGESPVGFFTSSGSFANAEQALNAVVEGRAAVAVVDGVALDMYRKWKPEQAGQLRVLDESSHFPTATILYKPGGADPEMLKKFCDGMTTAHERTIGKQMLMFMRLSQISTIPSDYPQLVDDILKVYAQPVEPAAFVGEPGKTEKK